MCANFQNWKEVWDASKIDQSINSWSAFQKFMGTKCFFYCMRSALPQEWVLEEPTRWSALQHPGLMWEKQSPPAGVPYLYQECPKRAGLWARCLLLLPYSGVTTTLVSQFKEKTCSVCQLSGTAVCWLPALSYPPSARCLCRYMP